MQNKFYYLENLSVDEIIDRLNNGEEICYEHYNDRVIYKMHKGFVIRYKNGKPTNIGTSVDLEGNYFFLDKEEPKEESIPNSKDNVALELQTNWEEIENVARKKGFKIGIDILEYAYGTIEIYKTGNIYANNQLIIENRSFKQIMTFLENMFDDKE